MNKREQVIEILSALLEQKQKLGLYSKHDIENAIMAKRGSDTRTIRNWWRYFWRLGFFTQEKPDSYRLNLVKVAELEMPIPMELDPKQRRLFG